jgi:hypothetical protein
VGEMCIDSTDLSTGTSYRDVVECEAVFTVVTKQTSFIITGSTRERILLALRHGTNRITVETLSHCACCDRTHTISLDATEVTGFIAHESESVPFSNNVVLLRTNTAPYAS